MQCSATLRLGFFLLLESRRSAMRTNQQQIRVPIKSKHKSLPNKSFVLRDNSKKQMRLDYRECSFKYTIRENSFLIASLCLH
jgi:hypothetical protein